MDLLCKVGDRSIIENESEYKKYLATLRKENDESIYKKNTVNNNNLDDVNKVLNYYISNHNKNFDFYFTNCEFKIEFNNNSTANIEIIYDCNTDYINIKNYLLFYIDSYESGEYKFSNINHLIFNTISCIFNLAYKHYINHPKPAVERRINMIIARNPQLINSLDRKKNHPLINKYSHIPFNDEF